MGAKVIGAAGTIIALTVGLKQQPFFLMVLEAGKTKMKALADFTPGGVCLLCSHMVEG